MNYLPGGRGLMKRMALNEKKSRGNLPHVNATQFSSLAVMEDYNKNMTVSSRNMAFNQAQTTKKEFRSSLAMQNHSGFLKPTLDSIGKDRTPETAIKSTLKPPSLHSGRAQRMRQIEDDIGVNRSNFFPSFDSRGNIGMIEDSDEFGTNFRQPPR